jgi:hypothetical protein
VVSVGSRRAADAALDRELVIEVETPGQIFNAPDVDPFSANDLLVLGMSGMAYVVRQVRARRRDWHRMRLVVRVPADRAEPGFDLRVGEAIRRYCRVRAADNAMEVHLIRVRSATGLGILLVIVFLIIAGAYLLFAGPLAGVPQAAQLAVAATISLFSWVSLWDPLEALIFNPLELMRENRALRRVAAMEIVVEPTAPSHLGAAATDDPLPGARTSAATPST